MYYERISNALRGSLFQVFAVFPARRTAPRNMTTIFRNARLRLNGYPRAASRDASTCSWWRLGSTRISGQNGHGLFTRRMLPYEALGSFPRSQLRRTWPGRLRYPSRAAGSWRPRRSFLAGRKIMPPMMLHYIACVHGHRVGTEN